MGEQFNCIYCQLRASRHISRHFATGYCYRALGKFNEAKRRYFNSLFVDDQDAITRYNLANLYRIMRMNELAIQEYYFVIHLKQQ
jgi:tetratricopeptide (TPR) repeat protein